MNFKPKHHTNCRGVNKKETFQWSFVWWTLCAELFRNSLWCRVTLENFAFILPGLFSPITSHYWSSSSGLFVWLNKNMQMRHSNLGLGRAWIKKEWKVSGETKTKEKRTQDAWTTSRDIIHTVDKLGMRVFDSNVTAKAQNGPWTQLLAPGSRKVEWKYDVAYI